MKNRRTPWHESGIQELQPSKWTHTTLKEIKEKRSLYTQNKTPMGYTNRSRYLLPIPKQTIVWPFSSACRREWVQQVRRSQKNRLNIQIWNSETCCDISYVRLPNLYGFIVPCTYLIQKQSYFHMPWRKEDNFEKVIWRKKIALNSKPSKSHYSLNCP